MNVSFGKIIYSIDGKRKTLSFTLDKEDQSEELRVQTGIKILPRGKRVIITLIPSPSVRIEKAFLRCHVPFKSDDRVFLNGYQSWTESREFRTDEAVRPLSRSLRPFYGKFHLDHFGDYYFTRYSTKKGKYHGYTYTYVRSRNDTFEFAGSLNEEDGFTVFRYDTGSKKMEIEKDCSGLVINDNFRVFDVLLTSGTEEDVFREYFSELGVKKGKNLPAAGWTSWYNYFTNISHEIVSDNLNAFKKNRVPIELFQIDDGYQNAVGDWLKINKKFPKGMKSVASEIRKAGFKPGIWIAPFICEKKSDLFREHPDWIIKDKKGKPLVIGNNDKWSGHFYALDLYNSGVKKYLKEVFETIFSKWGFEMVKVDFVYAACVRPDEKRNRGQIMSEAMRFLRRLAGKRLILGCGVPLGSAFGLVDYCRIGCDADIRWEYEEAAAVHYRERVATVNAIVDTIGRRHLDGMVFRNDPDVFILRHQNNNLSADQKRTLFLVNQIFGSLLFTSDHIGHYSDAEMREYLSQFPLMEKKIVSVNCYEDVYRWKNKTSISQVLRGAASYQNVYEVRFLVRDREFLAYINLGNKLVHIQPEKGSYYDNYKFEFTSGGKDIALPPYGSVCYSCFGEKEFEIAGSTGHLFSGCDVKEFAEKRKNIVLKIEDKPARKTIVYVSIPEGLSGYKVNGKFIRSFTKDDKNLLRVAFE